MSLPSTLELARLEELRQAEVTVLIADDSARFPDGSMSFASAGSWCNQACAVGLHGEERDAAWFSPRPYKSDSHAIGAAASGF